MISKVILTSTNPSLSGNVGGGGVYVCMKGGGNWVTLLGLEFLICKMWGVGPYDLRSLSGQGSMVLSPKYVCAMIY